MDLEQYWRKVRDLEETISDESPFVMSLHDPSKNRFGGHVAQASRRDAARLIADGSHRLANDDEVAAYREAEDRLRADYAAREKERLVRTALFGLVPADPAAKRK